MLPFNHLVQDYVWPTTLGVTIASVSVFIILVFNRSFTDKRFERKEARKKEMEKLLLIHISNPLHDLEVVLIKHPKDLQLLAEIAPKLLRTLKGNAYQTLLDAFVKVGLYQWLLIKLNSRSKKERIIAASLAGHWPDKKVKRRLKGLLKDKNDLVKYAAVEAIAYTKDIALFPTVVREFKRSHVFSYPLMCDVFQHFGSSVSEQLARLAKTKNTPQDLKMAAMMALAQQGNTLETYEAALTLVDHENPEMRALAFYAIAQTSEPLDKEYLLKGKGDAYWRVRQFVAECACNSKQLPADILMELLADENWLVGRHSAEAIYQSDSSGKQLLGMVAKTSTTAGKRAQMMLAEEGANGVA